jgi:hypothetical protein
VPTGDQKKSCVNKRCPNAVTLLGSNLHRASKLDTGKIFLQIQQNIKRQIEKWRGFF